MIVPIVLALWEHPNFGGIKRTLVEDEDLGNTNFNDKASSVGVHPGPDVNALGFLPTVSLLEHPDGSGVELVLPVGQYPNLNALGLNDAISTVRFNVAEAKAPGIYRSGVFQNIVALGDCAPIAPIPLVVELYSEYRTAGPAELVATNRWFAGGNRRLMLVEPTRRLESDFGSNFNDSIVAARVRPGPNHAGEVARLFEHPNFGGRSVAIAADDAVVRLSPLGFAGVTSSVGFTLE